MKKEEIHLQDWERIFFGQTPPVFLLEVFIRTVIIYIILLFVARWLGKRMNGQLTIMELAVMLTLGAIVSVPMQMEDRGLLQGVLLLIVAGLFQRGISWIGFKWSRMEDLITGKCSLMVEDGVLNLEAMKSDRITKQQLYAQLRTQKIFNLGDVERVYLEACGIFSILRTEVPRPGLPIFPPDDKGIYKTGTDAFTEKEHLQACKNCGYVMPLNNDEQCKNCGAKEWVNAIGS